MILLVVLGGVCSCSRNQGPQQIESSEATPTENVTDTPPTRTPPLPAAPSSMAPVETPPVSTPPATPTTTETSTFPSSAAPVSHSSPTTVQETPRPESERVVLPGSIPGEVTVSNPPPAPPVIPETTSTTTTPPTVIFSLPVIGPSPPIPPSPDSGGSRVVGGGPLTDSTRLNLNLDNLGKKLIWFSPAFPTTQYIANHQNELDQLPVDGLVFDVLLNRSLSLMTAPFRYGPDNTLGRLLFAHTPNVLGSVVRFDPSDPNLTMAVSEMAEEKNSGRHNFLSVATGFKEGYYRSATALSLRPPAWNDDVGWANATANWELAARIAKQTGAKGLMLDFEPYGDPLEEYVFNERLYPGSQSIARARGRQIMQAMQRVFPDIVLIVPWSYSATLRNKSDWRGWGDHFNNMAVIMSYAKNFLDGMLESIPDGSSSRILDGYEFSYGYTTPSDFNEGVNEITNVAPQNVAPDLRSRYASFVAPAFAFWLDWYRRSDLPQWSVDNRMNSVPQTETMIGEGLRRSSQYSWIYSERATLLNDLWWSNRYTPIRNVDSFYLNALWKAKGTDFGVKGMVEGIDWSGDTPVLRGWTCRKGYPAPLNINLFFRDPGGSLSGATPFVADESSEPELSEVCGSKGRRFRFSIPLTPFAATFAHKEIVVIPADSFGLGTMSLAGRLIQPAIVETGAGRPSLPVWSEIRSLADRPINLLSNPGFETDGFWQSTLLSAPGSATAEILSTDRYNGLRSAQLNFLVPESSARWHQNFLVPGQKTLGLKIHYKTSADFTGSAQAGLVTEETTYRLSLSPTGGVWQQAELGNIVINAPGMRSVELLLNGMGRGKVIFDSLELSKVEDGVMSPVSLVADAGFEHGSPLWQTHSASGEYYFLIDREVSRTGRYAARITTSSSESVKGQGSQGRWYQKSVSVVRGHRYHLSIAVKTSGSEDPFPPFSGLIGVWVRCDEGVLGACNRNYSLSPTGGEWRTLSGDFIPSTDTVDIYLNSFGENTGGSVWFDDITISE